MAETMFKFICAVESHLRPQTGHAISIPVETELRTTLIASWAHVHPMPADTTAARTPGELL